MAEGLEAVAVAVTVAVAVDLDPEPAPDCEPEPDADLEQYFHASHAPSDRGTSTDTHNYTHMHTHTRTTSITTTTTITRTTRTPTGNSTLKRQSRTSPAYLRWRRWDYTLSYKYWHKHRNKCRSIASIILLPLLLLLLQLLSLPLRPLLRLFRSLPLLSTSYVVSSDKRRIMRSSSRALLYGLLLVAFPFTVLSVPTSACGKDLPSETPADGISHVFKLNQSSTSTPRTLLIRIPTNYEKNTPVPVILSFHGNGKNASYQETLSGFSREDWNPNAIAVYPQGILNRWEGDPAADKVPVTKRVDDIGFIADVISLLSSTYCVDDSRIYATGKSNGGGFTNLLACDPVMSTKIAAFAPVSGAFYIRNSTEEDCKTNGAEDIDITCSPGRERVPILDFHGLVDNVIHYAGGPRREECLPSIPHWVREWSAREGFGRSNKSTSLFDGNVTKYEYAPDTPDEGIVTHYAIKDLSHDWPSIIPNADNTTQGTYFDATPLIMEFFAKYSVNASDVIQAGTRAGSLGGSLAEKSGPIASRMTIHSGAFLVAFLLVPLLSLV